MTFDMREVHHEDRPMRGTREYLVRVVLRLLAGDVQHGVCKFDFDKLSDEDEEAIHAVCDAAFDFIFLHTLSTSLGTNEDWNGYLAADKNVFKQGVRYEGHRPKHARLHNHGRPSPPHARHPGNVQDATAPMPTKTGRSVRLMKGGLSEAYSYPSLAQSLLAFPHSRSYGGVLSESMRAAAEGGDP